MEKKFRRKLTPFLCKEMLYDFATDRLDEDRKHAVSEFIKGDQECQSILDGIRRGLECAERLSKTEFNTEVISHLRESDNALSLGRRYSSWREWPESLRWSIIAITASASAAMIIALVPWNKLPTFSKKKDASVVELAQIPTADGRIVLDSANSNEETVDEGSGDEMFDPDSAPAGTNVAAQGDAPVDEHAGHDHGEEESPLAQPPAKVADKGLVTKPTPAVKAGMPTPVPGQLSVVSMAPTMAPLAPVAMPQKIAAADVAKSNASKPTAAMPVAAQATPAPVAASSVDSESSREMNPSKDPKAKGFVYRAFMNLSNLEELAPKITDNIVEFGGEKAGEVELGWKRGSGRYYHFTLPESGHDKLLEALRAYGPVRISKDPHPRIMPEGQVRFILWVESVN